MPLQQLLADQQLLLCLGSALALSFLLGVWCHVLLCRLDPRRHEWEDDDADDHGY